MTCLLVTEALPFLGACKRPTMGSNKTATPSPRNLQARWLHSKRDFIDTRKSRISKRGEALAYQVGPVQSGRERGGRFRDERGRALKEEGSLLAERQEVGSTTSEKEHRPLVL